MATTDTKTIDEALYEARTIVNDTQVPFRNPDTTLLLYLNTALRALYAVRPDAYIGDFSSGIISNNAVLTYDATDLGLTPPTGFPVDDRLFYGPVVAYIAARIEIQDDEFTENARSQQLMASFIQQLQGV
jgi:hypothetical protein